MLYNAKPCYIRQAMRPCHTISLSAVVDLQSYIVIYIYTYRKIYFKKVHTYIYIYGCICTYIYIYIRVYRQIYVYLYIYPRTYRYICHIASNPTTLSWHGVLRVLQPGRAAPLRRPSSLCWAWSSPLSWGPSEQCSPHPSPPQTKNTCVCTYTKHTCIHTYVHTHTYTHKIRGS